MVQIHPRLKAVTDPVSSVVVRSSAASMVGTLQRAGRDSLFFQQRLDLLDGQLHSGLEPFAGYVMEQAGPQLAGNSVRFQVPIQVDAANHQFAGADAGLEDQSQTAVGDPVIDDLDHRMEIMGQIVQDQRVGPGEQVPPLPVAVRLGREFRQGGVPGVAEDSQGVGWLALRPGRVPEDRGEAKRDLAPSIAPGFPRWNQEQHAAAALEDRLRLIIEPAGNCDARRRLGFDPWRVDRDVPIVLERSSLQSGDQPVARGGGQVAQWDRHGPERDAIVQGILGANRRPEATALPSSATSFHASDASTSGLGPNCANSSATSSTWSLVNTRRGSRASGTVLLQKRRNSPAVM